MKENKKAWEEIYNQGDSYLKYPNEALVVTYHRIKHLLPQEVVCLDYGFGSGNNSEFIIDKVAEFYGLEVSPKAKDITAMRLEGFEHFKKENLVLSDNEFISEFEGKFDLIVAWHVLSYNNDDSLHKVIEYLHKYLKKGGLLITTLATPRDVSRKNSQRQDKNTYMINSGIANQEGCVVVIPNDEKEFESYFSQFKTIDIGHEERISYMREDYHSHYYGVFQK
ncbi:MAG TPA: class I SAM-dependent methyltransferase [Sulfurimonas autotrophica]|nr:class I SAM-dependent methyltransferase [Sulfurimonas autotrophica]